MELNPNHLWDLALGLGASKSAGGTSRTAIIYNQDLLTFQGVSTDGTKL
jgi:hypothetical protein